MEGGNHLLHTGNTSGHAANHLMLIAIIDSHVWVRWPDQTRLNSTITLFEIVKITIHGVLACDRIIKIPVLNHHLRLHETRLCPLQRGQIIPGAVVADTYATFRSPVRDIGDPRLMFVLSAGL